MAARDKNEKAAMRIPTQRGAALATLLLVTGTACAAPTARPVATPSDASTAGIDSPTVMVPAGDAPQPATSPGAANLGGDLSTYTDTATGITVDYPAAWSLTEPTEAIKATSQTYSATVHSWTPEPGGQGGIPAGGTKFDLTVVKEGPTDLDAFAGAHPEWAPPDAARVALRSGQPAIRLELADTQGGPGPTVQWLAVIEGQPVILSGVGDLALVDAVAQSLRMAR